MAFTVEEFRDLLRILEERPEWRAELRRLVLTDELLTLPELVRGLVEAQQRTEERLTALVEAQQRIEERLATVEERLAALAEAQQRIEERLATVEERLAALAEAQQRTEERLAALAEAQQRIEERLATVEERLAALAEAQQRTEERLAALAEAQQRTEERLAVLTDALQTLTSRVGGLDRSVQVLHDDLSKLKGYALEARYYRHAPAYFAPLVRRTRVLDLGELQALLEEAVDRGQLSESEALDVVLADVVVRGRRQADGAEVYLVVEVSWIVDPYDVERAVRRSSLLSQIGTPALAVVAGETVMDEAANLANRLQVWQITNGHIASPQSGAPQSS
jgi:vacuolar-type H+-ATPase subunit I/STV1